MRPSRRLTGCSLALALAGCAAGAGAADAPLCEEVDAFPPTRPRPAELALEAAGAESPIERASSSAPAGAPSVAWDGRGWAVAWGTRTARLAPDTTLLGEPEVRGEGGDATTLEVGACHGAVLAPAAGAVDAAPTRSLLSWIDREGTPVGAVTIPGIEADVARRGSAWTIAAVDPSSRALALFAADPLAPGLRLRARAEGAPIASPRVVSTDTGTVVSWIDREGIVQRAFEADGATAGRALRVMSANVWSRGAVESTVVRGHDGVERIVVAATDGAVVHVAITDAHARQVLEGPLAVMRTTARGVRPGLAAIPELGLVVACAPAGPGPWGGDDVQDRVQLALIGPDAAPVGRVLELARGGIVGSVSCAWNGRELLAVWSREVAGRAEIVARRARLREGALPPDPTPVLDLR